MTSSSTPAGPARSWAIDRPTTNPFARPRGALGVVAGLLMALTNGRSCREVAATVRLRPGQTVLEVGHGPGLLLRALARRPERPRLVGVEPAAVMTRLARRLAPTAELRAGTAADPGLPAASIDHAVSLNTVAIWPDLEAGLDGLRAVLRPGGTLTLAWHGAHAASRAVRGHALPAAALTRIEDGLRARFTDVRREHLTDVVAFRATR